MKVRIDFDSWNLLYMQDEEEIRLLGLEDEYDTVEAPFALVTEYKETWQKMRNLQDKLRKLYNESK